MALVPMVVEQTSRGERAYDIYSRLLRGSTRSFSGFSESVPHSRMRRTRIRQTRGRASDRSPGPGRHRRAGPERGWWR